MSKYIDLELALNELLRLYEEDVDIYGVEIPETFDYHRAKETLQSLPTIKIICCKDCRWAEPNREGDYDCKCHIPIFRVSEDGWCNFGERKEE